MIPMNLATQNRENLPDYKQYISLGFTPKPEKKDYGFIRNPPPLIKARIPKFPDLRAIFQPTFPIAQWSFETKVSWLNLPFHSYGIVGDFHPTSFEVYGYSL